MIASSSVIGSYGEAVVEEESAEATEEVRLFAPSLRSTLMLMLTLERTCWTRDPRFPMP